MSRALLRRFMVAAALAMLLLFSFGGVREYRRQQWRSQRDHWIENCSTRLTVNGQIESRGAGRVCGCLLDYISVRWTPERHLAEQEQIERAMIEERIPDGCLDWAGGWAPGGLSSASVDPRCGSGGQRR